LDAFTQAGRCTWCFVEESLHVGPRFGHMFKPGRRGRAKPPAGKDRNSVVDSDPMNSIERLADIELFAWLGEDEFGSGVIGLKQALVPAGRIPMAAVSREKMEKHFEQAEAQAAQYGKRIYLCRFTLAEVLRETREGS
jgi:hypothetical protein